MLRVTSLSSDAFTIEICSGIALAVSCLAIHSALKSQLVVEHKLIRILLLVALTFGFAFTGSVNLQTHLDQDLLLFQHGKHDFNVQRVATFASCVSAVLGNFFSKIALCAVLMTLAPTKLYRLPTLAIELTVLIWTAMSMYILLGSLFKVPHSNLSAAEQYSEQAVFWYTYSRIDVVTDIAIIVSPLNLVRNMQLSSQAKATILCSFLPRGLATAFAAFRMREAESLSQQTMDLSPGSSWLTVVIILQLFSSTLSATSPHLLPFRKYIYAGSAKDTAATDEKAPRQSEATSKTVNMARTRSVDMLRSSSTTRSRGNSPRP